MSHFEFNPERNTPIYGSTERSYPVKEPIDYRLWIVELIYVYSIGKNGPERICGSESIPHRLPSMGCGQGGTALISFHEAGFSGSSSGSGSLMT